MNDTEPGIERKMREMMMKRSGAERLLMGASMFDAARSMLLASLPKNLSGPDLKQKIFERTYGASMKDFLTGEVSDSTNGK